MKFRSTRGSEDRKTGAQAIIAGIAEDKGLYVPESMPRLPMELDELSNMTYQAVATEIIRSFFDDYTAKEISDCIYGAYDEKFEEREIAPLRKAGDAYFLELYHGKTAAFKDMALSILPYLLTTAMRKENEDKKICILTATSGDTGKAALEGFADVAGTEIIVFFPDHGVSEVQEQQMRTQEGANCKVYGIRGNFDDAQTGVKKIFADNAFAEKLAAKGWKLSSANSINIGRLVPQVAYYVWAYGRMVREKAIEAGEPINVCVPTGNFGNILAAYYAKQMGLPIKALICASNKNRVLTDFINTGVYDISSRDFYLTNSPSMDILISSNLERLLFHLSGEDGEEIKKLMASLDSDKRYEISDLMRRRMKDFVGGCASVEETNAAIGKMYKENGYLMDTHTAVAYKVYEDYRNNTCDITPTVIASTASAYKFADSAASSIGLPKEADGFAYIEALAKETGVRVPKGLKALKEREVLHKDVIDIKDMEDVVDKALG